MTMNELQPGTIAVIHGKAVFVTSINTSATKNKIIIKKNIGSNEYCASPDQFTDVVGTFDLEKFEAGNKIGILLGDMDDHSLPGNLKGCKVGDTVNLTNGKTAIFQEYKSNRPKNPVAITINGKPYKCPLSMISEFVSQEV